MELVKANTHMVEGKERIEWKAVSALLSRPPLKCKQKWISINLASQKKGHFTPDEDAIIEAKIGSSDVVGTYSTVWSALGKELGRPAKSVAKRWSRLLYIRSAPPAASNPTYRAKASNNRHSTSTSREGDARSGTSDSESSSDEEEGGGAGTQQHATQPGGGSGSNSALPALHRSRRITWTPSLVSVCILNNHAVFSEARVVYST